MWLQIAGSYTTLQNVLAINTEAHEAEIQGMNIWNCCRPSLSRTPVYVNAFLE